MPNIDAYFGEIDDARLRRAKELSEIKRIFADTDHSDVTGIKSKAAVVLTYANWEGFYNECIRIYVNFLNDSEMKIADVNWTLLVGALTAEFKSLRDKNHSTESIHAFVACLKDRIDYKFNNFNKSVVESRSNLNFSKLSDNFSLLNFNINSLQKSRIRLDKELVGWRHGVAHGSPPDLSDLNISDHADFTAKLLLTISDIFQNAILEKWENIDSPEK